MVERVKLPPATPAASIITPVRVPATLPLLQLPVNTSGKATVDDPSVWVPATHVGTPGSWLRPGSAMAIWGVIQGVESLSLSDFAFQINKQVYEINYKCTQRERGHK